MTMINIERDQLAQWIQGMSHQAVMLTISKPHAKAQMLKLDESHLQHMLSRIIEMANHRVLGKHKHFDFLRGLVVCEQSPLHPHFHVLLVKPESMEFEAFERKLTNLASRLCDPDFELDLSETPLHERVRQVLSKPCYRDFARLTPTHCHTGSYLTKQRKATYYPLTGRRFSIHDDRLDMFVSHQPAKEVRHA